MDYFSKEERFDGLIVLPKVISLNTEMHILSGDFYGIQKFIFDRLSTKYAAKVLRAKSAFIQIFSEYLAKYICSELGIADSHILSITAGRFEIIVPQTSDIQKIDNIQKIIDNYFISNFYGLSGVMLCSIACTKTDFDAGTHYKNLRSKIINTIEEKKFQKFSLHHSDAPNVLSYDTDIDNQTLCRICNIRKQVGDKEHCNICANFIALGRTLALSHQEEIASSDNLGIELDGFKTDIILTNKIKSYVRYENREIVDFNTLSEHACSTMDTGVHMLAVLKADVDNMGLFLQNSTVTESFEDFDAFSRSMDNFFSLFIPQLMRKKYPHTYTVFAGGDDLFLLGAWDEILALAREIEETFKAFVSDEAKALTISFGIAMTKPTTPISYLAEHTEHLLEEAKEVDGKDAICLFGETVKWNDYLKVYNNLYSSLENFEEHLNTAFLYRLLELIEMSKKVKYAKDIASTMWKSKFRYSFNRNVLEKMKNANDKKRAEEMLELLGGLIDNNPKETKMVVTEFIYKRRES